MTVSVIGGDKRLFYLVKSFLKQGCRRINVYCVDGSAVFMDEERIRVCGSVSEALSGADIVISSIPFSRDGTYVNSVQKESLTVSEFTEAACKESCARLRWFFAGVIPESVASRLTECGIAVHDLNKRDDFAIYNAIPTAEGCVQYIMENMSKTIHGSDILIIGSGRVGKVTANVLNALGARVAISSRKSSDKALLEASGIMSCGYDEINTYLRRADAVINTVPAKVLTARNLSNISSGCLRVDLASGGCFEDAVFLPALPGKVAPESAATYINNVIVNIVTEAEGGVVLNGE